MLKTEASGERSTLRSASPHRNAYRAEFQALKKAFDQPLVEAPPKPRGPDGPRQPRGRQYGAHVSRIKDMFMQMTSEGVPVVPKTPKGPEEAAPQKMTKPTNFINKSDGSVIKLQHSVSAERIASGAGGSKFSETRKLFEQQSRDTSQSPVYSYSRDKRGSHEHLDDWRGPRSNRGSTDSLDSLCSRTEASSPTVSQLSAVFENVDHLSQGAPVRRGHGGRALYSPDGSHRHGDLSEDDSRQSPVRGLRSRVGGGKFPMSSSEEDLLSPSPLVELKPDPLREEPQERGTAAGEGKQDGRRGLDGRITANGTQINGSCEEQKPTESVKPTVEDKVVPSALRPLKDTADGGETPSKVPDTPGRADGEPQREAEVPGEKQTPSAPEDQAEEGQEEYRGNERVIFNADGDACYQGWGESCTDPEDDLYGDEDEDVVYDPGADLTEIPGLPEEDHEEVPPSRKIRFSTAPMMVFNTYCNEDYDRRNEEVDPVASSAEYELEKRVEKLELFPVELEKGGRRSRHGNTAMILDEPQVPRQLQSCSVSDWSSQQVAHWLLGLSLEHHIPQFTATNVDGERLLQLGSAELKALGVSSSQDRALIKKKVKDLKVLVEKARRSRDKQEKLHRKELDLLQKHTRKPSETAEGAAE
ncbi:neurabin-1 [Hypomesus transpacificus]|uniref:neurabin-1 n=1 Tax=Hypomesus transpacificus TaxID=137520 RepID=UPI001F077F70|nr:neurabin-1 [Hypomesus transpacificus]